MAPTRRLSELAERVLAAVELPAGPVAVALSGGADSAVCAWAAVRAGTGGVAAVHVDHGLPGSAGMAEAASAVAGALGIPLQVVPVPPGSAAGGEAAARNARYRALDEAVPAPVPILVAHTADDQAETVLLALLRGAGLDGLAGMRPVQGRIVRPLLGVDRTTLRELGTLLGLPFRDDPANDDLAFLRNRIRRRLLPTLESEYAAGLGSRLAASAGVLDRDRRLLDRLAEVPVERVPGGARVAAGILEALGDEALVARAIRSLVRTARPPYAPGIAEVAAVSAVLEGATGGVDLPGGVRVRRDGPWIVAMLEPSDPPGPVRLVVPGTARWGGWLIEASLTDARPPVPLSTLGLVLPLPDADPPELEVRGARRGDRIPLPSGSKGVFDALAEAGVAGDDRVRRPVVLAAGEVVWIPGVRRTGSPPPSGARYLCAVALEESQWERSGP